MSRIALIDPDWVEKNDDENLPDTFVVKVSRKFNFFSTELI